jgi:hypothetical protein
LEVIHTPLPLSLSSSSLFSSGKRKKINTPYNSINFVLNNKINGSDSDIIETYNELSVQLLKRVFNSFSAKDISSYFSTNNSLLIPTYSMLLIADNALGGEMTTPNNKGQVESILNNFRGFMSVTDEDIEILLEGKLRMDEYLKIYNEELINNPEIIDSI